MSPPVQPPGPVRVLLVDDHAVVRVGLKTILADDPRLSVVGEAGCGADCLRLAAELRPAVVLLDLRLPDLEGFEVCRRLKALPDPPAVLVLTSFADDQLVLATIAAGADGYLLKDLEQTDLPTSILRVATGGAVLDPAIARKVLSVARSGEPARRGPAIPAPFDRLSVQEQRVLELIAAGRTNKEVAHHLGLGEGTVRNYLTSVFSKLGVDNRTEAVALWIRAGI